MFVTNGGTLQHVIIDQVVTSSVKHSDRPVSVDDVIDVMRRSMQSSHRMLQVTSNYPLDHHPRNCYMGFRAAVRLEAIIVIHFVLAILPMVGSTRANSATTFLRPGVTESADSERPTVGALDPA